MKSLTIKDLENLSGIKAHTIRTWEKRYGFLVPQRQSNNFRYYNFEELKRLLDVALLNQFGHAISSLASLSMPELRQLIAGLDDPAAARHKTVNELILLMIEMEIDDFETVLDSYILAYGMEDCIHTVVIPFLGKAKQLWQKADASYLQETITHSILRQKLIAGIDGAEVTAKKDGIVLLFLPPVQSCEVSLLCLAFLLKIKGARLLYLGNHATSMDLRRITEIKQPRLVITHVGTGKAYNFIQKLSLSLPPGGIVALDEKALHKRGDAPAITFIASVREVVEHYS